MNATTEAGSATEVDPITDLDLITRAEAASIAGVHIRSVDNWRRSGLLRSYRPPHGTRGPRGTMYIRVSRAQVLALLTPYRAD